MAVTPTALATRRIVTDSTPSRSSSKPALATVRFAIKPFMYTSYTNLVYGVYIDYQGVPQVRDCRRGRPRWVFAGPTSEWAVAAAWLGRRCCTPPKKNPHR